MFKSEMHKSSLPTGVSLLRAFLVSMLVVAVLFVIFALGIWFYTTEVLKREETLISELLPELDVAFQLTAATTQLQSHGSLLLSSNEATQLKQRNLQLDQTIARMQDLITTVTETEPAVRDELGGFLESVTTITTSLYNVKLSRFQLREQVLEEQQNSLEMLGKIERLVQIKLDQFSQLLLDINEQMEGSELRANQDAGSLQLFADLALEFETTNLAIQDYLLFGQDLVLLRAVVEKVPLLTDVASVFASEQNRALIMRALVNQSIYFKDRDTPGALLDQLRILHDALQSEESLFELQKSIIQYELSLVSLGELLSEPITSILHATDALRDDTSSMVARLAKNTLEGLENYRFLLVALTGVVLIVLAGICYGLLYRKTVVPLMQISKQLDDVGTAQFCAPAKPYFLKEMSTLSSAMVQLDQAHKSMQGNDVRMQAINRNLSRANEGLEQFAHIASHDLQEPLRKLQQFSDLLQEDYGERLDDDGKYYVTSIRRSATRMSNLIRETLAFSRAGSDKQKTEPVDLRELLCQLREELEITIAEAEGEVLIGDLPVVKANRLGMSQLFMNLMVNALKYRKPGLAARVSFETTYLADDSQAAMLILVKDNGVGIEEKYQQRIFQPFERFHTEGVRGSGLGLAICQKICDAHRWKLDVSSTPGEGTTFKIRISHDSLIERER